MNKGNIPWNKGLRGHGICKPNSGSFKKGNVPWNVDLAGKGVCKPNSGSFKPGNVPPQDRGGFYTDPRGQVYEWVVGEYQPSGPRKYKARSRRVMEEVLGRPLKSNEVVIHLDNNAANDDPRSLKVITRGQHATRNRWGGHTAKKKVKKKARKKLKKKVKPKKVKPPRVKRPMPVQPVQLGPGFCSGCGTLMAPGSPCSRC